MVIVTLMSASGASIAVIAYFMVEMGKTQDQIQSDRHILRKDSSNHTVLRISKLHRTAFGMLLTRMVTFFDLYHSYILLLNG